MRLAFVVQKQMETYKVVAWAIVKPPKRYEHFNISQVLTSVCMGSWKNWEKSTQNVGNDGLRSKKKFTGPVCYNVFISITKRYRTSFFSPCVHRALLMSLMATVQYRPQCFLGAIVQHFLGFPGTTNHGTGYARRFLIRAKGLIFGSSAGRPRPASSRSARSRFRYFVVVVGRNRIEQRQNSFPKPSSAFVGRQQEFVGSPVFPRLSLLEGKC